MLKLRMIGLRYSSRGMFGGMVVGSGTSASHLPGGLPMGSAKDLNTAKSEFREAWKALKARTPPEQLAAAYRAMNIRGEG